MTHDQNTLKYFVEFAHTLADHARPIAQAYFRKQLTIETKTHTESNMVTLADQQIENELVELIQQRFPTHGVIREEHDSIIAQDNYTWVIDPIDGTSSFIVGRPIWGTLLALVDHNHQPLLGLLDQPILDERWTGVVDQPSQLNGKPIQSSAIDSFAQTVSIKTTPAMFNNDHSRRVLAAVDKQCGAKSVWGGDCYSYGSLAANFGPPMVILENTLEFYDFAALIPIVQGAGGCITNWNGEPLGLDDHQVVASSNGVLHEQIITTIQNVP